MCDDRPAELGCGGAHASGDREGAQARAAEREQRALAESVGDAAWFRANEPPYVTSRGRLASALKAPQVLDVFVGEVVGEHAFEGERSGGWGVMTWCSIRVDRSFKGSRAPGDLVEVLYYGGTLAQGWSSFPSHEPRCLPFDYGVFAVMHVSGIPRPFADAQMSMLGSELAWSDHHYTRGLEQLAPGLASTSGAGGEP